MNRSKATNVGNPQEAKYKHAMGQSIGNMILNEEAIPLESGTHQGCSLSPLPSNRVLKQEKEMKGKQIGKSQAHPICTLNDTLEIPQILNKDF